MHRSCDLVVGMDGHPDEQSSLIPRLFAMATARCEDAATAAMECQGRRTREQWLDGANELISLADELATLGRTIAALLGDPEDEQR